METSYDLECRGLKYEGEMKFLRQKIHKLKSTNAQAQSDKIEVMRDIATFEADMCGHL